MKKIRSSLREWLKRSRVWQMVDAFDHFWQQVHSSAFQLLGIRDKRGRKKRNFRGIQPMFEFLEERVVPTISISGTPYPTLAIAVANSHPGDTISIDATGMPSGGYVGGVTINTSLSIAGPTSGTLPTICAPTTTLKSNHNAIIDVSGGASVTISNIIVDGSTAISATDLVYGVYVGDNATLSVNSSSIYNIDNSFTTGVGLQAGNHASDDTGTAQLSSDVIGYYQAGAVVVDGPSSAGTITDCVVAAFGDASGGAANDIQSTYGASVTVNKAAPTLTVSDTGGVYNGSSFAATATIAGIMSGVDDTPASTLEGVSPIVTYFNDANGTLSSNAPIAVGTYTVFASFPGSTDYLSSSAAATVAEYAIHTKDSAPNVIVAGPDGNLWFTESAANKIGVITLSGLITEFSIPTKDSDPTGIVSGPDGNLWFTESAGNNIGKITPTGLITEYPLHTKDSDPTVIVAGPDGNLWFTESAGNNIGKITPSGKITEYLIPTINSAPNDIVAGPDGNLWFTEGAGNNIGMIAPTGLITEYSIHTISSDPTAIVAGPDGNLWFTESAGNKIGMITPGGLITDYLVHTISSDPTEIVAGPDGNLWFTESSGNRIGMITPGGLITEYLIPTKDSDPTDIVAGLDGNLWFTESGGNNIGMITPGGLITEFFIPTKDSDPTVIVAGPDGNLWYTESAGNNIGTVPIVTTSATFTIQTPTATSLTSPNGPTVFGQVVTFTATVNPLSPFAGTPTGTVEFWDGSTELGTGTLSVVNGNDVATFSTSVLALGDHSPISAVYEGDTIFVGSSSSGFDEVIEPALDFTSVATGDWRTALTWSGGEVGHTYPIAGDTATITNGYDVTIPDGESDAAANVTLQGDGSTLTLGDSAAQLAVAAFDQTGGALNGAGILTVLNEMTWTGGVMSGSGTTQIDATATLQLGTAGDVNVAETLDGWTLVNYGTASWVGGQVSQINGSTFDNEASLTLTTASGWEAAPWSGNWGTASTGTFNNEGVVTQTADVGTATFTVSFENTGTVTVASSSVTANTLNLAGNVSDTVGTWQVGTGSGNVVATLEFSGGGDSTGGNFNMMPDGQIVFSANTFTLTSGVTFLGAGNVSLTGGALVVNTNVNIVDFSESGGTLEGTQMLKVTGNLIWTGGSMAGTGLTEVLGNLQIGAVGSSNQETLDTRSFQNDWSALWIGSGSFDQINGSIFTNENGAIFDIESDCAWSNDASGDQFVNEGTIEKSANSGTTTFDVALKNEGIFDVEIGTVNLAGGGTSDGNFSAENGATLDFAAGGVATTLSSDSDVSGAGTVIFAAGAVSLAGTFNVTGSTQFTGATVTFNDGADIETLDSDSGSGVTLSSGEVNFNSGELVSITNLTFTGGIIGGSDTISVSGQFIWTGGTMEGSGATNADGYLQLGSQTSSNTLTLSGWTLNNGGTGLWISGSLLEENSSTFDNESGASFQISTPGSWTIPTSSDSSTFENEGTMLFAPAGGTVILSLPFNNTGDVEVANGLLSMPAGGSSTGGTFNVWVQAELSFSGIGTTFSLDSDSTVEGAGTVEVASSTTVTIAGTWNVTGTTLIDGGTLGATSGAVLFDQTLTGSTTPTTDAVSISSGVLDVESGLAFTIANLTLTGGTLSGTDAMTISGGLLFTGGSMSGSGSTTIEGGIQIGTSTSGSVTLNDWLLTNEGTAVWVGGNVLAINGACFDNVPGAEFSIQTASSWYTPSGMGSVGASVFNNIGDVVQAAVTGTTMFGVTFNNSGNVVVETCNLTLQGGGENTGDFDAAYGNTLTFAGSGTTNLSGTISGTGIVEFANGTLTVAGTYSVTGSTLVDGSGANVTFLSGATVSALGFLGVSNGAIAFDTGNNFAISALSISGGIVSGSDTVSVSSQYINTSGTTPLLNIIPPSSPAPIAMGGQIISGPSNTSYLFTLGAFNGDGSSSYSISINWGDDSGTDTITGSFSPYGIDAYNVYGTHTYSAEGTYLVTFTVTDANANSTAAIDSAVVTDPVVPGSGSTITAVVGQQLTNQVVATFTDNGLPQPVGNYAALITWGDGTTSPGAIAYNGSTQVFSVLGSHTYSTVAIRTVTVTISHQTAPTVPVYDTVKVNLASGAPLLDVVAVVGSPTDMIPVANFAPAGSIIFGAYYPATINWGDETTPTTGTVSYDSSTNQMVVSGSHIYSGSGSFTITTSVVYNGATSLFSRSIQIDRSPPLVSGVTVGGTTNIALPSNTVVATFTDPSGAGTYSAMVDWGDDSSTAGQVIYIGSGTYAVEAGHTYPETGSDKIVVQVIGSLGDSGTGTSTAVIVAPTLNVEANGLESDDTNTVSGVIGMITTTDLTAKPNSFDVTVSWGDSHSDYNVNVVEEMPGDFEIVASHTYGANGNFTFTISVTDSASRSATATGVLTIGPNDLSVGGLDFSAATNFPYSGTVAQFSDNNSFTSTSDFTATIDWGDSTALYTVPDSGIVDNGDGTFGVDGSHTYTTAGDYTVTISATDIAGETVSAIASAQVAAPSLQAQPNNLTLAIGQAYSGSLLSFVDVNNSAIATAYTANVSWGDGYTEGGVVSLDSAGDLEVAGASAHAYSAAGSYPIIVTLTDGNGDTITGQSDANVYAGNLTFLPSGTLGVISGQDYSGPVGTFVDVNGTGDTSGYYAMINWGDSTLATLATSFVANADGSFTIYGEHTYGSGSPANPTITVTLTAGSNSTTGSISVNAVSGPIAVSVMPESTTQYQDFSDNVATFVSTDAPGTAFTATIDWGDGATSNPDITTGDVTDNGDGTFTVSGEHTYTVAATEPIIVTVTDDANVTGTGSGTMVVGGSDQANINMTQITTAQGLQVGGVLASFQDRGGDNNSGDFVTSIDWGDGSSTTSPVLTPTGNGNFNVTATHSYTTPGDYTWSLTVTTGDGESFTDYGDANVFLAVLSGQQDSIQLEPGQAFDGEVASFNDLFSSDYYPTAINWGDGTPVTSGSIVVEGGGTYSVRSDHTYAVPGTYIVTVQIFAADGYSTSFTDTVTVATPMQAAGNSLNEVQDQQFTGTIAAFSGSPSDSYTASIDWGDDIVSTVTPILDGSGGFKVVGTHTYDSTGTYPAVVTITDTTTGASTQTSSSIYSVVAPFLIDGNDGLTGAAGLTFTQELAKFYVNNEAAPTAGEFTALIGWSDSTVSAGTIVENADGSFSVNASHNYVAVGDYTVSITVSEFGSGETAVSTVSLHVVPAAINATEQDFQTVPDEWSTVVLATFTSTNPSAAAGDFTANVDLHDDGMDTGPTIVNNGNGTFSVVDKVFYSALGNYPVDVTITGLAGETDAISDNAHITDLWVTTFSITLQQNGYFSGAVGHFDSSMSTDPNAYYATIDWGDGNTSSTSDPDSVVTIVSNPAGGFDVEALHSYAVYGGYTVTLSVDDPVSDVARTTAIPLLPTLNNGFLNENSGATGQDPASMDYSTNAPVRYADGAAVLTTTYLSSSGFGVPWGQTVTWSSAPGFGNGINGNSTDVTQLPFIKQTGPITWTITVGSNTYQFDYEGGTYVPHDFLSDSLEQDGSGNWIFTDTVGDQLSFFSLSTRNAKAGQLNMYVDPNGNIAAQSVWNGASTQLLGIFRTDGTVSERYVYAYGVGVNTGLITAVTLQRRSGNADWNASWTTVEKVAFTYYTVADQADGDGNARDLELAQVMDGQGRVQETDYYRYYTPGETNGYQGGLKLVVDPDSYERMIEALRLSNPSYLNLDEDQLQDLLNQQSDDFVANYAQYAFEYYPNGSVRQVTVAGAGGSATDGFGTYAYSYYANPSPGSGYNSWNTRTTETAPDGSSTFIFTNYVGEVMLTSADQSNDSADSWDDYYRYDDEGRLILHANPSAVTGYSQSYGDLVGLNPSAGTYQYIAPSSGLIQTWAYSLTTSATESSAGTVEGYFSQSSLKNGTAGQAVLQNSVTYFNHTGYVAGQFVTVDPTAATNVYANNDGSGAETTTYSYIWYMPSLTATDAPYSTTVTTPNTLTQNGQGASSVTTVFDAFGRPIWTQDALGNVNYNGYDQLTGAVTLSIVNVSQATFEALEGPSSWTVSPSGLDLTTSTAVDNQGRTTDVIDPNGKITYISYDDENNQVRTVTGSLVGGKFVPVGTIQVVRQDWALGYTDTLTMSTNTLDKTNVAASLASIGITGLLSLSRTRENTADQNIETDSYFNVSNLRYTFDTPLGTANGTSSQTNENANYYSSYMSYDTLGRMSQTTTANGTIYSTVYDSFGQVDSTWVTSIQTNGNVAVTNGWTKTSQNIYDNGGVGDGNLTKTIQFPGGGSANRVAGLWYDWRDRQVASEVGMGAPLGVHPPITVTTYDNLGEAILVQQYDGDSTTVTSSATSPSGIILANTSPSSSPVLVSATLNSYDNVGQVFRTQIIAVNSSPSPTTGCLATVSAAPTITSGGSGYVQGDTLTVVGGTGVAATLTVTSVSTGGVITGVSLNNCGLYSALWSNPVTVTGGNGSGATFTLTSVWNMTLTTNTYRDLNGQVVAQQNPGGQWNKYVYDGAGRVIQSFVTNGGVVQNAFTVNNDIVYQETDTTYDNDGDATLIVTRQRFDDDTSSQTGQLGTPTTGVNARDYYVANYYDVLNRVTMTVNVGTNGGSAWAPPPDALTNVRSNTTLVTTYAYDQAPPSGVSGAAWATTQTDPRGIQSRQVYNALGQLIQQTAAVGMAVEQDVSFTYDGDGNKTSMTTVQQLVGGRINAVTAYVYAAQTSSGSGVNSNDILTEVRYPQKTPINGVAQPSNYVTLPWGLDVYTVNALGQNVTFTDRNGTTHKYTYDVLGRLISDFVERLGTNVDGSVRQLTTTYTALGLVYQATSLGENGTVVNQVQNTYNGFGQMTAQAQSVSGAITGSPAVQYNYSFSSSGDYSRLTSTTYPSGLVITYGYNAAGVVNSLSTSGSNSTSETDKYLGLNTLVQRVITLSGGAVLTLSYISNGTGAQPGGDRYQGLDRFGRVVDQYWFATAFSTTTVTDDFQFTYDADGNILTRYNALQNELSEKYTYDDLNQVKTWQLGTLSSASATQLSQVLRTINYEPNALGNTTNAGQRYNAQNQQTNSNLAYDANGNLVRNQFNQTQIYNAWNQLVKVQGQQSNRTVLLAGYQYDALGRRVSQEMQTSPFVFWTDRGGQANFRQGLYSTAILYYLSNGQVAEQKTSSYVSAQNLWSPVGGNMLTQVRMTVGHANNLQGFAVDQDPTGSTTTLISASGLVDERYRYDPYGNVTYMGYAVRSGGGRGPTTNWTALAVSRSQYGMTFLFQGGQLSFVQRFGTLQADTYRFGTEDEMASLGRWISSAQGGGNPYNGYDFRPNLSSNSTSGSLWEDYIAPGIVSLPDLISSAGSKVRSAAISVGNFLYDASSIGMAQRWWNGASIDQIIFGNYGTGWFSQLSNFSAGIGDTVSMGLTNRTRGWLGYNDVVDQQSGAYITGQVAGTAVNIALGFANPCGLGAMGVTGGAAWALRGINAVQAIGGSFNFLDNVNAGNYGMAALDALGVFGNVSSMLRACFEPDTPTETKEGVKVIDEVVPLQDYVLSRSESDPYGPLEYKLVLQKFERYAFVVKLHLEENRVLGTTSEHPFLKEGAGWVPCGELLPGDRIWTKECRWVKVEEVFDTQEIKRVINLQVEDFATFFVGGCDWGFSVWAHNACEIVRQFDGPIHHIASDKSSRFTPLFQSIFDKAGLSLQSAWNRMRLPGHVGPHGSFYSELILRRLSTAVEGTSGAAYRSALIGELKSIRWDIRYDGWGDLLKAAASRADRLRLY